jgi:hypothetical protein
VSLLTANNTDIVKNRTNNPLESFNRRFKESFKTKHSSMTQFVDGIYNISVQYLTDMHNIQRGLDAAPPRREPVHFAQIPLDYASYKPAKK